jgi:DNA-binding NarL/FixJ family response regulator
VSPISVVIVDDDAFARKSLALTLNDPEKGVEVWGECNSPEACLELFDQRPSPPQAAVIDLQMQGDNARGLQLLKEMRIRYTDTACMLLTHLPSDLASEMLPKAVELGARGFFLKASIPGDELSGFVRRIYEGEWLLDPNLKVRIDLAREEHEASPWDSGDIDIQSLVQTGLSQRELEILKLVYKGLSDQDIAERLGISANTVKNHLQHVAAKFKLATEVQGPMGPRQLVAFLAAKGFLKGLLE